MRRLVAVLLLASAVLSGCAMGVRVQAGERPGPGTLDSLTVGKSTADEVRSALGAPVGTGRVMLPHQDAPRTLWSYYYTEATLEDARQLFLFVYFDGERYDGYLWFSSFPGELGEVR